MRIKVILQNYNTTHTKYQELLSALLKEQSGERMDEEMCIRDSLYCDAVGGDAAIGALPVREQRFHILRFHMVVPVAASGLVQFLSLIHI